MGMMWSQRSRIKALLQGDFQPLEQFGLRRGYFLCHRFDVSFYISAMIKAGCTRKMFKLNALFNDKPDCDILDCK